MNLSRAMIKLGKGKKVRHKSWKKGVYMERIEGEDGGVVIFQSEVHGIQDSFVSRSYVVRRLPVDGWEVYKDRPIDKAFDLVDTYGDDRLANAANLLLDLSKVNQQADMDDLGLLLSVRNLASLGETEQDYILSKARLLAQEVVEYRKILSGQILGKVEKRDSRRIGAELGEKLFSDVGLSVSGEVGAGKVERNGEDSKVEKDVFTHIWEARNNDV